jgi:hypothetical protein
VAMVISTNLYIYQFEPRHKEDPHPYLLVISDVDKHMVKGTILVSNHFTLDILILIEEMRCKRSCMLWRYKVLLHGIYLDIINA